MPLKPILFKHGSSTPEMVKLRFKVGLFLFCLATVKLKKKNTLYKTIKVLQGCPCTIIRG